MDSGTTLPAHSVISDKAQATFDQVAHAAGCGRRPDQLACLREVPYETLLAAQDIVPRAFSYSSQNFSYLPRPDPSSGFFSHSPEIAVRLGRFTRVPIITGDQEDEGTLWSLFTANASSNARDLASYFRSWWPGSTERQVLNYVSSYSADPSAGSPFHTARANELYPGYKRFAAILGDSTFILQRRKYLSTVSSAVPAWSYLASYLHGLPYLGTFHGTDVLEAYKSDPIRSVGATIRTFYIHFVHHLDPNRGSPDASIAASHWPRWTEDSKLVLDMRNGSSRLIVDDFREDSYKAFLKYQSAFSQ